MGAASLTVNSLKVPFPRKKELAKMVQQQTVLSSDLFSGSIGKFLKYLKGVILYLPAKMIRAASFRFLNRQKLYIVSVSKNINNIKSKCFSVSNYKGRKAG